MATYRLEVDATEFRAVLKRLKRFARGMRDKSVRLSYTGGNLALAAPGITITIPAEGRWPKTVRVTAKLLIMLIKVPPPGDDPVVLSFDGERLSIADCSMGASIDKDSRPRVDVLPSRRLCDLLRMGARWSYQDLRKEGFMKEVRKAQDRRDLLLARAAKILSPLGIEEKDLRELLDQKLKRPAPEKPDKPEGGLSSGQSSLF